MVDWIYCTKRSPILTYEIKINAMLQESNFTSYYILLQNRNIREFYSYQNRIIKMKLQIWKKKKRTCYN